MDETYFLKTFHRFCESRENCSVCELLNKKDNSCIADIDEYEYVKKTVQIVEQWAKDHSGKTRQSEFLKMFPNANTIDGVLTICPIAIDKALDDSEKCLGTPCHKCLEKYWLAPIDERGE